MFTDMKEALEAEALELTPLGNAQSAAASRVVAHHAHDQDDLADLLGALGLPCREEDIVRLLPHLTTTDDPTTGEPMPVNAFTATAVSMLKTGDQPAHVRETLGLSESELAEALRHTATYIPQTVGPTSRGPVDSDGIEDLLRWANNHAAAAIRNKAARIHQDLCDLSARRASESAQREAEERVAQLKAELEQAQETLRTVKAGGRSSVPTALSAPNSTKRSKEQLAAIRTWARAHGHKVADTGLLAKAVLDAYDAAHPATLAEAS